jgi:hypothetical protein
MVAGETHPFLEGDKHGTKMEIFFKPKSMRATKIKVTDESKADKTARAQSDLMGRFRRPKSKKRP